jgi:oligopeptide/dipeptide ABC transporter ATP-binding protein
VRREGEVIPVARHPTFAVESVTKEFGYAASLLRGRDSLVRAVDNVSLQVCRGEVFGLVGESGSGKTTLGRLLVRFERPTRGQILFEGTDLSSLRGRELLRFRRRVQMIFQNPFSSLNPRRTIRDVLASGYAIHGLARGRAREEELRSLLHRVGLHEGMLERYPHEFSGGQRQRIVIARALSVSPEVLVADEPVSALDVSIQAQVLNLLRALQRDMHLTIVLITHDLRVANFFCDRIGVLYLGRLVETGRRAEIVERSYHPYTRMLLSAAPSGDPDLRRPRRLVHGDIAATAPPREACVFSPRCWLRAQLGHPERCVTEPPPLRKLNDGHLTACHYAEEVDARGQALEPVDTEPTAPRSG